MSNRFKFRAWDINSKKYLDDFYIMATEGKIIYSSAENEDEVIIEQCTGFKGKNGRLIYEGDIIKETSFDEDSCAGREIVETCVVCFGGGDYPCSFTLKNKKFYKGYVLLDSGINRLELEVIGNIHENPELMEE